MEYLPVLDFFPIKCIRPVQVVEEITECQCHSEVNGQIGIWE